MDLGRWRIRRLGHAVGKALGSALDGDIDMQPISVDGPRDAFEIQILDDSHDELDRALALIRPGSSPEKILSVFAPYFEGGICLRLDPIETDDTSEMRLTSLFLFGQTFTPPDSNGTALDLDLTSLREGRVLKTSIEPLLRALKLGMFSRLAGASAFAFKPASDVVFVLFDHRPHPWQVLAVENAFLSARDVFSRIGSRVGSRASRGFFR